MSSTWPAGWVAGPGRVGRWRPTVAPSPRSSESRALGVGGQGAFAPPSGASHTWVCPRCRVRQVDVGWPRCANCELPRHRWVAHPPPGGPPPKVAPPPEPPYTGPPSYRGRPPRWAFPPVVWEEGPAGADERPPTDPSPWLRIAAVLAAVTAVLALLAAAAETWRFALLLEGRTKVLSGVTVWSSDVFVAAAGAGTVAAAVAAL